MKSTASRGLKDLGSLDFRLLVGLVIITLVEAITYAWIEVLLYTSVNPEFFNLWLLGHYSTYHIILSLLVLAMIFGTGVAWIIYTPMRFRKFVLLTSGNLLLWILLEDEFTFIFSKAAHTATDWTNWPIGAVNLLGYYIPVWYFLAAVGVFVFWFLGLSVVEK